MTKISIIVATDENNAIGKNGGLLCYLPNDLKFFKTTTSGFPVIMGRRTYESLPKGALPDRRNIVITNNKELQYEKCEMSSSVEAALKLCADEPEVFFIGGGTIYKEVLDMADTLYITRIRHAFEAADTYFPEVEREYWTEVWRENHKADEKHKYDYSFLKFAKINR